MFEKISYATSFTPDELRLDLSELNPGQEYQLKEITRRILEVFQKKWGSYFSKSAEEILPQITSRIFASDADTFSQFYVHYNPSRALPSGVKNNEARSRQKGDNEKKAVLFEECGADYYAFQTLRDMGRSFPKSSSVEKYMKLIGIHGEVVHKVFFGTATDEEKFGVINDLQVSKSSLPNNYFVRETTEEELLETAKRISGSAFLRDKFIVKNTLRKKRVSLFRRIISIARRKPADEQTLILSISEVKNICHETAHMLQDPNLDDFMSSYDEE